MKLAYFQKEKISRERKKGKKEGQKKGRRNTEGKTSEGRKKVTIL